MDRLTRQSVYRGGYDTNIRRELDSIELPEWLTCSQCGVRRTHEWYSRANLAGLRQRIYQEGNGILALSPTGLVRCSSCASNPLQSERTCKICGETKALDSFARNQRQYQEPTCIPCQDFMMNDDIEFEARGRLKLFNQWRENSRSDLLIEGPPDPSSRHLLRARGEDDDESAPARIAPPVPARRLVMHHEAFNPPTSPPTDPSVLAISTQNASAPNRVAEPQNKIAPVEDQTDLVSNASSESDSNSYFGTMDETVPDYGSDEDTIVPAFERSRTGWSKIRPNRHRPWERNRDGQLR